MFERFTERARQVIALAQEEAKAASAQAISTEFLLAGLLREEKGIAAQALSTLGVSVEGVRAWAKDHIGENPESGPKEQVPLPFTPRTRIALELSLREALSLGHNYIGTEHILLGILRDGDGPAVTFLRDTDLGVEQIRRAVISRLSGPSRRTTTTAPHPTQLTLEDVRADVLARLSAALAGDIQGAAVLADIYRTLSD